MYGNENDFADKPVIDLPFRQHDCSCSIEDRSELFDGEPGFAMTEIFRNLSQLLFQRLYVKLVYRTVFSSYVCSVSAVSIEIQVRFCHLHNPTTVSASEPYV